MATSVDELKKVSAKPELLLSTQHSLCPGCGEPLGVNQLIPEFGFAGDVALNSHELSDSASIIGK